MKACGQRHCRSTDPTDACNCRRHDSRKTDDFGPAGEAVDNACENCHLKFWYPDQDQLLLDVPKPK
jgi:hypothetical protein